MDKKIELFDVIAFLHNMPEYGLRRGEVGTIVEALAEEVWLVEFSDNEGEEYATIELHNEQFIKLYYVPVLPGAEHIAA
jgi:hypothetical protein